MEIRHTKDFTVNGLGDAPAWRDAAQVSLSRVSGESGVATTARMLYSDTGIYVLFDCEARQLYAPENRDFAELYNQDVAEVFLQPDPTLPAYLEYEMCPLGAELPLMVLKHGTGFHGWLPFHYAGERRIRHGAHVRGGDARDGAPCEGWTAECFIPYALLEGVLLRAPVKGDRWHGNFYRIEHDAAGETLLAYAPVSHGTFHQPDEFAAFDFV